MDSTQASYLNVSSLLASC